jgi:hypothetical protein
MAVLNDPTYKESISSVLESRVYGVKIVCKSEQKSQTLKGLYLLDDTASVV